ncbi:MAG: tRNA (guanosine(37)-N1)-methyltransferase TrmD [Pseudomonadota bacterium]
MAEPPKPRSAGMLKPQVSAQPRPLMENRQKVGAFTAKVLTLFPDAFPGVLEKGLTGKALSDRLWSLEAIDIRRFATDKHRTVDDTPAGGGPGMVMRADIVAKALDFSARGGVSDRLRWPVIYLSPRGRVFDQPMAEKLAAGEGLTLICGRYEGLDERVLDARGIEEVSIGDYVLTGGEAAAQVLLDAVIRLRPGVLGNAESTAEESFSRGLIEHPHYTRPQVWEGRGIPDVLLSGHHARIAEWRLSQAEGLTKERRPDLWAAYENDRESGKAPKQSDATNIGAKPSDHKDEKR